MARADQDCPTIRIDIGDEHYALKVPGAHDVGFPFPCDPQAVSVVVVAASAIVSGHWEFDVPAGYALMSCQGFGVQPVPSARRTWGSVKAAYR